MYKQSNAYMTSMSVYNLVYWVFYTHSSDLQFSRQWNIPFKMTATSWQLPVHLRAMTEIYKRIDFMPAKVTFIQQPMSHKLF